MTRTSVIVSFRFEGFHRWPDAPNDIDFLRERHRHEFHVKATKPVSHDDREVEIVTLKREMMTYVATAWPVGELGRLSCESIASLLVKKFGLSRCEVLEDGENGAEVSC